MSHSFVRKIFGSGPSPDVEFYSKEPLANPNLKTADGSTRASSSIGELSTMVKAMQKSVAGFKLPGVEPNNSTVVQSPEDLAAVAAPVKLEKQA